MSFQNYFILKMYISLPSFLSSFTLKRTSVFLGNFSISTI